MSPQAQKVPQFEIQPDLQEPAKIRVPEIYPQDLVIEVADKVNQFLESLQNYQEQAGDYASELEALKIQAQHLEPLIRAQVEMLNHQETSEQPRKFDPKKFYEQALKIYKQTY